jgi:cell wall-active antibiotic response 4TMS protein YvqF
MNGGAHRHRGVGRLVAGGILILLGLIYTLDSFGVVDAGDIGRFWPLILIGIGITKLFQARFASGRTAGFILIAIGSVFLLRTLHVVWFRGRDVWPVVLVLVGGALIWQALTRRSLAFPSTPGPGTMSPGERVLENAREGIAGARARSGAMEAGSVLNEFAIMGGGDRVVRAQDFRGGEVTAIMGGFGIDLRGAAIAGDSAVINVFTLWGGVDFKVPEDWNVAVAGTPILGVFTNSAKTFRQGDAAAKTLVIKGVAIMGGVEVKN